MSDLEAPDPDVAEQRQPLVADDEPEDAIAEVARRRPIDANEADVLEQSEDVPVDDDDFR